MIVYNRRKRTEFYAVMEKLRSDEYAKALEAQAEGKATDDQMLLINQENLRFEQQRIDKEKKEKGVWRRMKESVVGTEMKEEKKGGTLGIGRRNEKQDSVSAAVQDVLSQRDEKLKMSLHHDKVEDSLGRVAGGPLDQIGQQTADAVSSNTRSWTSWITGR